jgi:hypothetical protein
MLIECGALLARKFERPQNRFAALTARRNDVSETRRIIS